MTAEELLSIAGKNPITLSNAEMFERKQTINSVFIESGGGLLDNRVMQAVELYSTGQMNTEDVLEFMRLLAQENS